MANPFSKGSDFVTVCEGPGRESSFHMASQSCDTLFLHQRGRKSNTLVPEHPIKHRPPLAAGCKVRIAVIMYQN